MAVSRFRHALRSLDPTAPSASQAQSAAASPPRSPEDRQPAGSRPAPLVSPAASVHQPPREDRRTVTYCSLDTLRARGWTPMLVRKLLGAPDRTEPVELYLTLRVEEAEQRAVFQRASRTQKRRRAALRRAAARRKELAIEAIRTARMELPRLSSEELARRSVAHRNMRDAQRAYDSWGHVPTPADVEGTDPAVLVRWEVRYLHALLAEHRSLLEALPTAGSRREGMRLLRQRTYEAIADAYPWLAMECRRQSTTEARGRAC